MYPPQQEDLMSTPMHFVFEDTSDHHALRMTPGSTRLDQEAFFAELAAATAKAVQVVIPVQWNHNGVQCSTTELAHQPDPWAWVCEASSLIAN